MVKMRLRPAFSPILSKAKELPQRELQDILGICSGSLSEILAKMEADGFFGKGQEQNRRQAAESAADGSRQKRKLWSRKRTTNAEFGGW